LDYSYRQVKADAPRSKHTSLIPEYLLSEDNESSSTFLKSNNDDSYTKISKSNIRKINIRCLSDIFSVNIKNRSQIYMEKLKQCKWMAYMKADFTFSNYYLKQVNKEHNLKDYNSKVLSRDELRDDLLERMIILDEKLFNNSIEYAGDSFLYN
jgi:hypothetical protein